MSVTLNDKEVSFLMGLLYDVRNGKQVSTNSMSMGMNMLIQDDMTDVTIVNEHGKTEIWKDGKLVGAQG